jgi:succinate dehydrogenase hydrophobic anchor subunit
MSSFASSKGSSHWIIEKFTSVFIVLFFSYFFYKFMNSMSYNYSFSFEKFFASICNTVFGIVFVGSVCLQSFLRGIALIEDYVHSVKISAILRFLLFCLTFFTGIFAIITIIYLHIFSSIFIII